MSIKNRVVRELGLYLKERQITYAFMGEVTHYINNDSGDVDLFVSKRNIKSLTSVIIDFCQLYNYQIVHINHHQVEGFAFILNLPGDCEKRFLSFDFSTSFAKEGRVFLEEEQIIRDLLLTADGALFQLHPVAAFSYYSLKKAYKGTLSQDQFDYLLALYSSVIRVYPNQIAANPFFRELAFLLERKDYDVFHENLPALKKQLFRTYSVSLSMLRRDIFRKTLRIFFPEGRIIAPAIKYQLTNTEISSVLNNMSGIFKGEKIFYVRFSYRSVRGMLFTFFKIYPQLVKGRLVLLAAYSPVMLRQLVNCYFYKPCADKPETTITDSFILAMHNLYAKRK